MFQVQIISTGMMERLQIMNQHIKTLLILILLHIVWSWPQRVVPLISLGIHVAKKIRRISLAQNVLNKEGLPIPRAIALEFLEFLRNLVERYFFHPGSLRPLVDAFEFHSLYMVLIHRDIDLVCR